ncbi:TonB-dependent receptor [bacterium]|nr:TonB-dependent receptor [bacterium]
MILKNLRGVYVLLILLVLLFSFRSLTAGTVIGRITDGSGSPVVGANVVVADSHLGSSTNLNGIYIIYNVPEGKAALIASHVGYMSQQKIINVLSDKDTELNFKLEFDAVALQEMTVKLKRMKSNINVDKPVRTEVISSEDLQKVSTDGGVLSALGSSTGLATRPCALCGSAGIGMQGLDPSYTEINIDGMPVISGLGSLYGLDGVSVSDVSNVNLVKGSGSSEYGAGAVAGAVNLVSSSPDKTSFLQFKASGSETAQHSLTGIAQSSIGEIPTRISLNYAAEPLLINRNNDDFTDTPQYQRFGVNTLMEKKLSGGTFKSGIRYYHERRFAGDVNWTESDLGSSTVYGREIFTDRSEVSLKYSSTRTSLGMWSVESAFVQHVHDSWYGATEFDAVQLSSINRISMVHNWDKKHSSLLQGSYTFEEYNDNLSLGVTTDRIDRIPGAMYQHTWSPNSIYTAQGGVRIERYQNDGIVPTLRGSILVSPLPSWTFRLAGGTGYRPVTIFSLDKAVHSGFDNVIVPEDLKAERSFNTSLSINYRNVSVTRAVQIDLTGFYTTFENKAILAFGDHSIGTVYSNADDAYSRGVELQTSWAHQNGWTLKGGGTLSEVNYMDSLGWRHAEMQNLFTANLSVLKSWKKSNLMAELSSDIYGSQYLPAGRSRTQSPVYAILNTGISKSFGALRLALNINNITDWVQPDDPFVTDASGSGKIVDSALIYGPLLGRTFRANLDYTFGKN